MIGSLALVGRGEKEEGKKSKIANECIRTW